MVDLFLIKMAVNTTKIQAMHYPEEIIKIWMDTIYIMKILIEIRRIIFNSFNLMDKEFKEEGRGGH